MRRAWGRRPLSTSSPASTPSMTRRRPDLMLAGIARALRPGGIYLCVDFRASSALEENFDHPVGPFFYAISCMHCMTVSLADGGMGLGTMWGEQKALEMLRRRPGSARSRSHTWTTMSSTRITSAAWNQRVHLIISEPHAPGRRTRRTPSAVRRATDRVEQTGQPGAHVAEPGWPRTGRAGPRRGPGGQRHVGHGPQAVDVRFADSHADQVLGAVERDRVDHGPDREALVREAVEFVVAAIQREDRRASLPRVGDALEQRVGSGVGADDEQRLRTAGPARSGRCRLADAPVRRTAAPTGPALEPAQAGLRTGSRPPGGRPCATARRRACRRPAARWASWTGRAARGRSIWCAPASRTRRAACGAPRPARCSQSSMLPESRMRRAHCDRRLCKSYG